VKNVLLKLARGHAAFELSQPCREEHGGLWWSPLALLPKEQQDSFNGSQVLQTFGEVGSRGLQRLYVTQLSLQSESGEKSTLNILVNDWIDVQEGRYRYHASDDGGDVKIKIVIAEYLACEVTWYRGSYL
jgi:hypothetical protein